MRLLPYFLLAPLLLPACAQRPVPSQNLAATSREPVLIFQRTPCFGRCPAYTDSVFADGRVAYYGQRGVPLLGQHTLRLPAATVADMLAEARRIGFGKLRESYAGNTTDLPATIITVHPVGEPAKAVLAAEDIPANLQGYIDYLRQRLEPLSQASTDK